MVYSRYNLSCALRVGTVVLAGVALGGCVGWHLPMWISGGCLLVLCWSTIRLFRFIGMINEQVFYFVRAVENNDTSLIFPSKVGNGTLEHLYKALNRLNQHLQKVKVDSQLQEKYFGHILSQVDVGVLVYSHEGFVKEVNAAALRLLRLKVFTHLNQLDRMSDGLVGQLRAIPANGKRLIAMPHADGAVQVVVQSTAIELKGQRYILLTLQDIRGELERKEIDAWVKIIRVLNHEIMNSLTPVTSLSQSLLSQWQQHGAQGALPNVQLVDSTLRGLDVIEERSRSLVEFVNSYRMLTKLPELQLRTIRVGDFLERISILVSPFRTARIAVVVEIPTELNTFKGDESMLVQVMLNLVKNGVEAIGDGVGKVHVYSSVTEGHVKLVVEDSGPGIPTELYEEIFVPFFTTKASGSGIGLSHSQQIVRAHGGRIGFQSAAGITQFFVEV